MENINRIIEDAMQNITKGTAEIIDVERIEKLVTDFYTNFYGFNLTNLLDT